MERSGGVTKAYRLERRGQACDRATGKALEGADRQTNRLYSKIMMFVSNNLHTYEKHHVSCV